MPWWWREASEQQQSILAAAAVQQQQQQQAGNVEMKRSPPMTVIAKAFLVTKRRLSFYPDKKLFFLYEPGQQVSSAVKIKNTSRSPVAFKFQTNAPKSCFMRPPNGILSPGETILAIVVKFVEQPERNQEKKSKDKFKIVSLKVKPGTEYTPELFDERKEFVAVERVLQVAFLDPQGNSSETDKLRKRLAEAEAAQQARKKPPEEKAHRTAASGGVLDEWKQQQREKRLAKQQSEGVDSL